MGVPNKIHHPDDPDQNYMPWNETEKGGGFRGGPRRWTGKGPRPARHIPWPEVFKHHLSLLEGHHKMLDMIRKHTVEGSGNHRTIVAFLDRTQAAIRQTKDTHRSFVPPPGLSDAVPIGSSSASMYPGYSPADILYGDPARELGEQWSHERVRSGTELALDAEGPQYELGQGKGLKKVKKSIAQIRAEQEALGEPSALRWTPRSEEKSAANRTAQNGTAQTATSGTDQVGTTEAATVPSNAPAEPVVGDNPYFVVDSKPMDVELPAMAPPVIGDPSKKRKRKNEVKEPHTEDSHAQDSEANLQNGAAAEEQQGGKVADPGNKRSKRQRKSQGAAATAAAVEEVPEAGETDTVTDPPKKEKKAKKMPSGGESEGSPRLSKQEKDKTSSANDGEAEPISNPQKKLKKAKKSSASGDVATLPLPTPDASQTIDAPSAEPKPSKKKTSKKSKVETKDAEAVASMEEGGKANKKKKMDKKAT